MSKRLIFISISLMFQNFNAFAITTSSFEEVRHVVFNSPNLVADGKESDDAIMERKVYDSRRLPEYPISLASILKAGASALAHAAQRTINDDSDYFPRINKLIHSSGICFTGTWDITKQTPYSGQFQTGVKSLMIARVSTATRQTVPDNRAFGFAGKIFPTLNPNEKVKTANFFTVDKLLGTDIEHFSETRLTNQPSTGLPSLGQLFDGTLSLGNYIKEQLETADRNIGFRPLYPVSQAGLRSGEVEKTPHWIMIKASQKVSKVNEADFRNELNFSKYYPKGMNLDIMVSDVTHDPYDDTKWEKIGLIHLNESVVSYGCDRELHFHHPKLRDQDSSDDDSSGY